MELTNQQVIEQFYTALSNRDIKALSNCYHEEVVYSDVGFGIQKGKDAKLVWQFLMNNVDENFMVTFSDIQANETRGSANWVAKYQFNQRNIENQITATFQFQNGKIIYHKDKYSLWKWSQQAFGFLGYLIGWLPLFRWLVRWQMQRTLLDYKNRSH